MLKRSFRNYSMEFHSDVKDSVVRARRSISWQEVEVLSKDVERSSGGEVPAGQGSLGEVSQSVNECEHLKQSDDNSLTMKHSIVNISTCGKTGRPDEPSFPFPNGLEMDPLAPTALVVPDFMDRFGSGLSLLRDHGKKVQKMMWKSNKMKLVKRPTKTTVSVILVEAKNLPNGYTTSENGLYCKFKLGTESHKSKQVSRSKASWCESFKINMYTDSNLEITMWNKGKQKMFMGRCIVDLSKLQKDRTHDLWQDLECGHGSLHLAITMNSGSVSDFDQIPTNASRRGPVETEKFTWYQLKGEWSEVGELTVTVMGANALSTLGLSKADAYCLLEIDNIRVQTHSVRGTQDPTWNKTFNLPIYDITSTLDISVYDDTVMKTLLGKVSIPLLRIKNDEEKWYGLKDRSNKYLARGGYAKIQLKMNVVWNPIKASVRLLSPKESKYAEKAEKFNIPLIYYNLKFIRDIFNAIQEGNEKYKQLLEWEDPRWNKIGLGLWLVFWFFYRQWMLPLILVAPFLYYWVHHPGTQFFADNGALQIGSTEDIGTAETDSKDEKTLKTKIYKLQDLTFKIKHGIDFIVSLFERVQNLVTFEVPYLSYLAVIALLGMFVAFYILPLNYLIMAFGIYKFTRKFLNPDRIPNNDLLDFLSRVPDNETLRQWTELKVLEKTPKLTNETLSSDLIASAT